MKHLLRLFLILLFVINGFGNLHAQITLTLANSGLRSGDQFLVHELTVPNASLLFSYASSRSGSQTWDFSQAVSPVSNSAVVMNRVTAPFPVRFPNANVVLDFQNGPILPQVLSYIDNTPGFAKEVATVETFASRIIEFTNPIDRLRFPFTFNDSYTDAFSGDYVYNGNSCVRFGNITVVADGYGTIITPAGTFNNVLRVKTIENANDSCPPNLVNPGAYQFTTSFDWYAPGIHFPVFRVLKYQVMLADFYVGFYLDTNLVGLKEDQTDLLYFKVYPNPAEEELTLQYQLKNASSVKLTLINALGQVVKILERAQQSPGTYSEKIKLNDYPKGIYYIRMQTGENLELRKIIIK